MTIFQPFSRRSLQVGRPRINWAHPLANGLIGCWLPGVTGNGLLAQNIIDLAGNLPLIVNSSGASNLWQVGQEGPAWGVPQGTANTVFPIAHSNGLTLPSSYTSLTQCSLYYRGDRNGLNATTTQIPYTIFFAYDNSVNPPYAIFAMGGIGGGTDFTSIGVLWNSGTLSLNQSASPVSFEQANTMSMLGTFKVGGNAILYKNGAQVTSDSFGATPPVYGGAPYFCINGWYGPGGAGSSIARNGTTLCYIACIWNRELSASEAQAMDFDPYGLLIWGEGEFPALFTPAVAPPTAQGNTLPLMGVA